MSHKITHRQVGQGPLLVLLHGYGGSVMHWDGVVQKLKNDYSVIAPNISHLFLSQDRIFFSIQIEVLAQFLRENFPNRKVSLAGISYGGALAWGLSVQYPELVEKLVLINPMVPDPGRNFLPSEIRYFCVLPWSESAIFLMLSTPIGKALLRRLIAAFRDENKNGKQRADNLRGKKLAFVAHLIHRFTWILRNEDWSLWKRKIQDRDVRVPVMLIFDEADYLFSQEIYQAFGESCGCEDIQKISGAGHMAICAQPEAIAKMMLGFLNKKTQEIVAS